MSPWNIENYYIQGGRVLTVEFTAPLIDLRLAEIDDIKRAWLDMLHEVVSGQPGLEVSWEMTPRGDVVLVRVRIAKAGELGQFTRREASDTIEAVGEFLDREESSRG